MLTHYLAKSYPAARSEPLLGSVASDVNFLTRRVLIAAAVTAGVDEILALFEGDEGVFSIFVKTWHATSVILLFKYLAPGARNLCPKR